MSRAQKNYYVYVSSSYYQYRHLAFKAHSNATSSLNPFRSLPSPAWWDCSLAALQPPSFPCFLRNVLVSLPRTATGSNSPPSLTVPSTGPGDIWVLGQSALALTLTLQPQGAFFPLAEANWSLPNRAVEPQLQEEERMVYVAFSEFFFDSAMESYFRAGALKLSLVGDKVCRGLFVAWARGGL